MKQKMISIIAPASWIKEEYLTCAVQFLRNSGFDVKCANQVHAVENSYMAGTDEERIYAIHEAFNDKDTDIILCAKGGYGCSRILDKLDKNIINNPNKLFLGYSDVSILNLFFAKYAPKTKIYFSPNLIDIAYLNADINHPTLKYFTSFLSGKPDETAFSKLLRQTTVLKHGKCSGELIGGTLTILMNTLGTPFEIDTNNKILFIEDKKEYVFKVERMLYHLKHAGKLNSIKGLIVGKFFETPEYHIPFGRDMKTMFSDFFKNYDIPILYNFPLGHNENKMPIPLNKMVCIDTQKENFGLSALNMF